MTEDFELEIQFLEDGMEPERLKDRDVGLLAEGEQSS